MKTAIIGCGNIARVHRAVLAGMQDVDLVAVADIKPDRAQAAAAECGARAYTDYLAMLDAEAPDCVHICTPHALHTPMALEALRRGIHVLTEKPCAVSPAEAAALIEAQNASGRQVGVCFQNRYNPAVLALKKALADGTAGPVKAIRAFVTWNRGTAYYSDDWHGTRALECGGVLINQAIHTVDLVQHLGGGCAAVTGHVSNDHLQGAIEVEDTAVLRMRLCSGGTALLYATTAYGEDARVMIEVHCAHAVYRIEGGDLLFRLAPDGTCERLPTDAPAETLGKQYWGGGHTALIRDFYDHLVAGTPFPIDAAEGGKASAIVAACYRSGGDVLQGKEVVL